MLHRFGHFDRILGLGNGGVGEHSVGPQLHRRRRIAGAADPCIDDDRDIDRLFDEDHVEAVLDPQPRSDGSRQGHHRRRTGLLQTLGDDGVVVGVGHNRKAVFGQDFAGFEGFDHIGIERLGGIADHLQFDQVDPCRFPGQAKEGDRLLGGGTPCAVG